MKPRILSFLNHWQPLYVLLLTGLLLVTAGSLAAAPGGRRLLNLELSSDQRLAKVKVPEGVSYVTIQMFDRPGGWCKVVGSKADAGVMNFRLPVIDSKVTVKGKEAHWRAIGWYDKADVSHDKFPAAFYKGKDRFGAVKSPAGSRNARTNLMLSGVAGPAMEDGGGVTGVPVEADIWKIEGNTVYFFNQLRGLQVLDLANPAEPHLTASLRLPAVGQDLYLLPSPTAASRTAVLLTEGWSDTDGQWTRINVVKVSGGKAEITSTQDVPGSLADSRLAGNRLILATTEWNYSNDNSDNWNSRSRLSEWLLTPDKAPVSAGETLVEGDSPLISAGAGWLALAVHPNGNWNVSEVSVFAVRPQGLIRMAGPLRTKGSISNKFAMQWSGNVLTTVSEHNSSDNGWSPTSILQNFRVWAPEVIHTQIFEDPLLGQLELAAGESLFATRFAGDKVYVVTFFQTDPLWVVDLSDATNPVVAGHIEVPGWSSHLEPIGDQLFAIGWESNTIVASLFNVADPSDPTLLRRLKLAPSGAYSEALWDEKALKVLPTAGLALIPLNSYDDVTGESKSVVQLVDIDTAAGELRLRGEISHDFDARRADLIGNTVVSVSQRVLVDADITNRDAPKVLSEVSLAWPVDRVLAGDGYLFQIENGNWYGGGQATVRVSRPYNTEEILSETDLGKGTVKAADYRDGKLYILREEGSQFFYYWRPVLSSSEENKLTLDIYDASAGPGLTLLGSSSLNPGSGAQVSGDSLLWAQPNRPAVVLDFRYSYWWGWGGPIMFSNVKTLAAAVAPATTVSTRLIAPRPYWIPEKAPRLVLFDVTDPQAPMSAAPVVLGSDGTALTGTIEAADGLIVAGTTRWSDSGSENWLDDGTAFQGAKVIDVPSSGSPIIRPTIELPGELFAVTKLDSEGFLAFTRTYGDGDSTTFQVSASDGFNAFLVDSVGGPAYGAATAGGQRLFIATDNGVKRHILGDDGEFTSEPSIELGWSPYSLRWLDGTLIGASWNSLFAADDNVNEIDHWDFQTWYPGTGQITLAADGDLLVPFGDYGAERLDR